MEKHLRARDVKLVPIGNSKGVRIPKALLQKYGLSSSLVLEETDQGILLRKKREDKLSWQETFKAMAEEGEDWGAFDAALMHGLEGEDAGGYADVDATFKLVKEDTAVPEPAALFLVGSGLLGVAALRKWFME